MLRSLRFTKTKEQDSHPTSPTLKELHDEDDGFIEVSTSGNTPLVTSPSVTINDQLEFAPATSNTHNPPASVELTLALPAAEPIVILQEPQPPPPSPTPKETREDSHSNQLAAAHTPTPQDQNSNDRPAAKKSSLWPSDCCHIFSCCKRKKTQEYAHKKSDDHRNEIKYRG